MSVDSKDEKEKEKRKNIWFFDMLKKSLQDAREFLPDAMKDPNSIVGAIVSMIMNVVEFFKKMFTNFTSYPADMRYNLSSEELKKEQPELIETDMKTEKEQFERMLKLGKPITYDHDRFKDKNKEQYGKDTDRHAHDVYTEITPTDVSRRQSAPAA